MKFRYVKVNKNHIIPIPDNLSMTEAAAIPEVWLTSSQLIRYSKIKEGDYCLVHAGSSGVGTALIQLIKSKKAYSIVICSSEDKLKFCEK
jgi:NADPH:quinone reductase-like Zn-dependent oxidoreductase